MVKVAIETDNNTLEYESDAVICATGKTVFVSGKLIEVMAIATEVFKSVYERLDDEALRFAFFMTLLETLGKDELSEADVLDKAISAGLWR